MKAYFLTRLTREKILILVLLVLGSGFWLSSTFRRSRTFVSAYTATKAELGRQQQWLGSKAQIESDAAKAISRLDPARTLDSSKLLAEVNRIAAAVGITSNVQADDTKDERSSQFALHSLRLTMSKVDYPTLVKFYIELQKHSPYIGLEQFSLAPDGPNSVQLRAMFRLTSVEVLKP